MSRVIHSLEGHWHGHFSRDLEPALTIDPGDTVVFKALERSTVMLLGGEPIGPRFMEWNFVSSSKDRIEQAKADWRAGRMKLPDLDNGEFIPLPGDPPPPANPMS